MNRKLTKRDVRNSTRRSMHFHWCMSWFILAASCNDVTAFPWWGRFGWFCRLLKKWRFLPCLLVRIHWVRLSRLRLKRLSHWYRLAWLTKNTGMLPSLLTLLMVSSCCVRSRSRTIWCKDIGFVSSCLAGIYLLLRSRWFRCITTKQTDGCFPTRRCKNSVVIIIK